MEQLKNNQWIKKINTYQKETYYLLFLLLSIGSVYFVLIKDQQVFFGDDLGFHLARIQGLADSIVDGNYFPRINYFITGGMGYATSIFYPDVFLYPAALIRLTGISLIQSYVIFVILINFLTFVIAYHSFYRLKKNPKASFLFAFLYGLSSYRMSDVLYRAAVGEYLALMVLPIAFVGIYSIVFGDYKKWYILAMGMACLFLAHILTAVIFSLFIICLLLCNVMRLIKKERARLFSLLYAAVMTILLVGNSLFPMIEQLLFQRLRVQDSPVFYLQKTALTIVAYAQIAWKNLGFNNLGIILLFLVIVLLIRVTKLACIDKQLVGIAVLFLFLSTSYFPHWYFQETVFNSIQFPWRYFILVTFIILWVFSSNIIQLLPKKQKVRVGLMVILMIGVIAVNLDGQQKLRSVTRRQTPYSKFTQLDGTSEIGFGSEFLPSGMDSWLSPTGLLTSPNTIKLTNMSREKNIFSFDFEAPEETKLIFPVLFYKGYEVKVEGAGTVSQVHDAGEYKNTDMHGFAEVTLRGSGHLTLWYAGTLVQKISFWSSLLAWFGLGVYVFRNKKDKMIF